LSTESQNAVRYFDEPRTATVFVKGGKGGDERQTVTVLLEDLGVAWELFRPGDALHVLGKDWTAILSPMTERDPNDGDGLPFAGYVDGSPMKVGEQYDNCEVRWYPRFGEATDLHALGVLAIEALLSNDERNGELFRSALTADCDGLTKSCLTMPVEHREAWIGNWLGERCETDAPAAVWTRRNLLYTRASRAGTRLDAFPPALWQAAMTWELRMITTIPGFSYCDDRTMRAPRIENELLPLLELRGILALIDDHLFKRSQPGAAMRAELTPED
jgi:hypothetical protein